MAVCSVAEMVVNSAVQSVELKVGLKVDGLELL